jgi:hypothetical protein
LNPEQALAIAHLIEFIEERGYALYAVAKVQAFTNIEGALSIINCIEEVQPKIEALCDIGTSLSIRNPEVAKACISQALEMAAIGDEDDGPYEQCLLYCTILRFLAKTQ